MSVYYPPVEQHETVITTALRVNQGTHYARADNPHADAEAEYGQEQLALAARALAEAVDALPADRQPIGWEKGYDTERVERGRQQLLEAMSAVSEERTCAGWCADWARTLHAEGGIWETLGRAVGWPSGNYEQWVWVSWDEAAAIYAAPHSAGGGE
ncbi:hypothetical protein AB0933_32695 [Streptomyces venezuelae]|uniref:hypothetical protein n=1 Tax=Streptomyces venezuelae TaxID=54571 RepID=UPI0034523EE7